MINTIIDTYHGNSINMQAVKDGGIIAIIHKATQGQHFRDKTYHNRRQQAKDLGLLWGAYHFSTGEPVDEQVENFLSYAKPEDDELISLDWEPSDGPDMSLDGARKFVQMIKNETGRWPLIYGGHLLRESLLHKTDPVLANCPLWYARYSTFPIGIPTQVWPTYTLWQYTDGNNGPEPHHTPGVGGADRNIFNGTEEQLRDHWPFTMRESNAVTGPGFNAILHS
jgi:lysozyme